MKDRKNVPNVEGARTPLNKRVMAPWRSKSRSSMLSAPASIPATTHVALAAAFGEDTDNASRCSLHPARSANDNAGTRPAHDTRFVSSKTARAL